jgi:hypothetical protein
MIHMTSITFKYKEGRTIWDKHFPVTVHSWDEAQKIMIPWIHDAPENGGYDKLDFRIEYEDGESYEGTIDLKREHLGVPNPVGNHVYSFAMFHAGRHLPDWMKEEAYQEILDLYGIETMEEYQEFLDNYDLGEVSLNWDI